MAAIKPSILERGSVTLDDQTLIAQCCTGDKGAFRELVLRYQRKIYGTALMMLHNKDDAMDATQEVFIKAHNSLGYFKGQSSFYTWLYRITLNVCIDHLRKEGKNQTVEYEDSMAPNDQETPGELVGNTSNLNPGKVLARKEMTEFINKALQQLSPTHRAILLMREVDGLSYTEMAEIMQCTKGTIMSRLFYSRKRMQEVLTELSGEQNISSEDW